MNKLAYDSFINWHHMRWQTAALVSLVVVMVLLVLVFNKDLSNLEPETRAFASTFNTRESGISGLWQLTSKAGLSAAIWQSPYRKLSQMSGMLVIVCPTNLPADFECKQILAWVAAGNDLVYLDDFTFKFTRRLLQVLDIDAVPKERIVDLSLAPLHTADQVEVPQLAHVQSVVVSCGSRLTSKQKLVPIVADKTGTILAALNYGKGHILLGCVPNFAANRRFAERSNWSNFQFLINWFRQAPGPILFDERCHGFSNATNIFAYLFSGPFTFVFAQLFLIALVAVGSSWKRFGPVKRLKEDKQSSLWPFIEAQASMLMRARSNNLVFSLVRQQLRTRLRKLTMLSIDDTDEAIVERLPATFNRKEILSPLNYPANVDNEQISNRELLALIADCDKITDKLGKMNKASERSRGVDEVASA